MCKSQWILRPQPTQHTSLTSIHTAVYNTVTPLEWVQGDLRAWSRRGITGRAYGWTHTTSLQLLQCQIFLKNIERITFELYRFCPSNVHRSCIQNYIFMSYCKKDVTPLLTHWSYIFLAITHPFIKYELLQWNWGSLQWAQRNNYLGIGPCYIWATDFDIKRLKPSRWITQVWQT